jgi:hypothetical protein
MAKGVAMRVRCDHSGITDLAGDLDKMTAEAPVELARTVRADAIEGNRIARAFASEQHSMHSDIDVPYQESFEAEEVGPHSWTYGPIDDGIPHGGSQATGYELGSRNQPPHLDLARSVDIIGPQFADDIGETAVSLFWPGA